MSGNVFAVYLQMRSNRGREMLQKPFAVSMIHPGKHFYERCKQYVLAPHKSL